MACIGTVLREGFQKKMRVFCVDVANIYIYADEFRVFSYKHKEYFVIAEKENTVVIFTSLYNLVFRGYTTLSYRKLFIFFIVNIKYIILL